MSNTVLVFEDIGDNYDKLKENLEEKLEESDYVFDIVRFEGDADDKGPRDLVRDKMDQTEPALVILDWDLTGYDSNVTREHVKVTCENKGIPLCIYQGNMGENSDVEQFQEDEEDSYIKIDSTQRYEEIAEKSSVIAEGFVRIMKEMDEDQEGEDLLSAVSDVLEAPKNSISKLDQYSWGQSKAISLAKKKDRREKKVFSTFLGYWVYNQLLAFPGVLLGVESAASYLEVDKDQFKDPDYQEPFEEAAYTGPFAELRDFWWKSGLDEIRADYTNSDDEKLVRGPDLFDRLGLKIDPVKCKEGHEGAGYYCIISDKPVCKEHSVRPEGWIPMGASRARISEDEFEKLRPWMS